MSINVYYILNTPNLRTISPSLYYGSQVISQIMSYI